MNADRQLTMEQPRGEVVQTDASSIMAIIDRAARDPAVDMDKLERLTALYERITERQSDQAYSEAMNTVQSELRPVAADANNPQTKSKYASYAALDRAIRPIYTGHGFGLSFGTADGAPPEHVRLTCEVSHSSGFKKVHQIDMPSDGKGAKGGDVMTKTHAIGAAISYGRRYLLGMIFNIAVGDDDDGNSGPRIREQSAGTSAAIAAINACRTEAELKAWKTKNAAGLQALPTPEADEVVRLFNQRLRKAREGVPA